MSTSREILVCVIKPKIPRPCNKKLRPHFLPQRGPHFDSYMELAKEQIRIAFEQSQKEVDDLRQRTREGMETAKMSGKQIGQKPGAKLHVKKADAAKKVIQKYSKDFGGSLSDKDVMKLAGVSPNTYYKYKAELRNK